ncbi:MAG: radical SAM family heme chaperone HemW [Deltaproteobacteria bacterium]|nr:radical SAM family heme chaperone HemW [Deltaproteobacteria bacterium]
MRLLISERESLNLNPNTSISPPGLYIHVPFCRSKCPYCGFYSVASTKLVPGWLHAFKKEVSLYKHRFDSFDSLYIGGGTPSLLDLGDLEDIMKCLFVHFHFQSNVEITLEANPGDMTDEKIRGLKSMGFNRVNLGVQSFDDPSLYYLGRRHNTHDAERALYLLRSYGFHNIGMDLIYGFETQTMDIWKETIRHALQFNPEHISCYQLTIEDKTPFQRMKDQGRLKPLDEEEECSFFLTGSDYLKENGYIQYEISNFAREEIFYSRHNCKYWDHTPYLGLGPAAHSFQGSRRWWNVRSIRQYCEALEKGEPPLGGFEDLTDEQIRLEDLFLGLRTQKGIRISGYQDNPDINKALSQLHELGYIELNQNRITSTQKGFLVADRLPLYLT